MSFGVVLFFAISVKWFYKGSKLNFLEHASNIFYNQGHTTILSILSVIIFKLTSYNMTLWFTVISAVYFVWAILMFYKRRGFLQIIKALTCWGVSMTLFTIFIGLASLVWFKLVIKNDEPTTETEEWLSYSTDSDSTKFYYRLGWKQIMDFGDYSAAEVSYRKALSFDKDFLLGKSVLARLTTDLEERIQFFNSLEKTKSSIEGDERLVLDVYIALTKYTNLRDQNSPDTKEALQDAFKLSEQNLGQVIRKYPKEVYLKSEYIEVIHALTGAESALDSMDNLVLESQTKNPFILGYKAILTAELEKYDEALVYAGELAEILKGEKVARPDAILTDIYFKMEDYESAKIHADRANNIDPKNLDASRLKTKIDEHLK
jgi:tetratricopeptide (TPR) repeat protein